MSTESFAERVASVEAGDIVLYGHSYFLVRDVTTDLTGDIVWRGFNYNYALAQWGAVVRSLRPSEGFTVLTDPVRASLGFSTRY